MAARVDRMRGTRKVSARFTSRFRSGDGGLPPFLFACLVACVLVASPLPLGAGLGSGPPTKAHQSSLQTADVQLVFPSPTLSIPDNSHLLAQSLSASLGLPEPVWADPAPAAATSIFNRVGLAFRSPPALGGLDAIIGSHTLATYAFGTEGTVWLFYAGGGGQEPAFLTFFLALHGAGVTGVELTGYESHATDLLMTLDVPILDSMDVAREEAPGLTTVVFSSRLAGYPLACANLAAVSYDNATGTPIAVQSWLFVSVSGVPGVSEDAALAAAREAAAEVQLHGSDTLVSERIVGLRLVLTTESGTAEPAPLDDDNVTTELSVSSRLAYEYVADLHSSKAGLGYSVLVLVDAEDGTVMSVIRTPVPVEEVYVLLGPLLVAVVAFALALLVISVCISTSPEFALFVFSSIVVPVYTRLRAGTLLDNFNRGRVYGYMTAKPGCTFTEIKEALGLGTGTVAYHLLVLERQELISTTKTGRSRRYFPEGVPAANALEQFLGRTESMVLDRLTEDGPRTNAALAELLGMSRQRVHYNLRLLRSRGLVKAKDGLWVPAAPKDAGSAD